MRPGRPGQFRSKNQAMNTRKHAWACLRCNGVYTNKRNECECGNPLHYFPSKAELKRFHSLRLEQRCGLISDLELQPSYTVVIEGVHQFIYRADFRYTRDGAQVIEDVKATLDEKYFTGEFKLKRKQVQTIFKIHINIVKG